MKLKTRYIKLSLFFLGIILLVLVIGLLFPFVYGPGIQDFTKGLTGRYNLYRNSSHKIFVAPEDG
ncbi:hypothetical protein NZD88_02120 [Chryseobacterium antibioticum]|uniref:Uncharacterized protein n=1 Tax=Chryseobacterium pyrolae TaxID=2987481 RepID=A0ABT2ICN2_9FLAO|nr:hypothetical protein [Chryseobacterium pyrolae]MCT2406349.1 hypothetical protein [Chryseobacterium pyrolae]